MEEFMLAASPSWYCSRVTDSDKRGVLVFGAKNSLFLLDISQKPPYFIGHFKAHYERVISLSLCKHETERLTCCSAGEEGRVKIWDLEEKTLLHEHSHHKNKVTVVHWSVLDKSLVVSGDEKGTLNIWRLDCNDVTELTPEGAHVFCLECSPHVASQVAVGYRNGLILVVDIEKKGNVLHRFRGHDDEVHCVTWCPLQGEDVMAWNNTQQVQNENIFADEEDRSAGEGGYLLASGSRDRTVRVWSWLRGKAINTFKLPVNTGYKRDRHEDSSRQRVWLTVTWPRSQPNTILSSAHGGELLLWDLCKQGKQKWEVISPGDATRGHTRIMFNIAAGGPHLNTLCTISMDRQLVLWDLASRRGLYGIPTLGGFAYKLALSPVNPNMMAIGGGDNLIRVWNYSSATWECNAFWQGIKAKVTALCWHPSREGILAYGTDDGRVGIYDVLSNKPPQISSTYHKFTVYVVTWGPMCRGPDAGPEAGGDAVRHVVYSCGDGVVLQHDPKKLDEDAINLFTIIEKVNPNMRKIPTHSEISWKPDFKAVAVGNEDGSVDIFSVPSLLHVCTVHVLHKLVNVCSWHPLYTSQSSEPSSCHSWLAIGSNESTVEVVDLRNALSGSTVPDGSTEALVLTESFRTLEGHSNRITGLSWSGHSEGILVSASYDWTAQVWDVKQGAAMANYRGHTGRLLCVQWSATDQDAVYTGGDDFCVHQWKVSQQQHKVPPKGQDRKKKKGKSRNRNKRDANSTESDHQVPPKSHDSPLPPEGTSSQQGVGGGDSSLKELQDLLEKRKKELEDEKMNNQKEKKDPIEEKVQEIAATEEAEDDDIVTEIKNEPVKKEFKEKKRRRPKSLFPVFGIMENRVKAELHQDCEDLASQIYKEEEGLPEQQRHLGLFTSTRQDTYNFMEQEGAYHKEHCNFEQRVLLELWKGNIQGVIAMATEEGNLSDYIMALAPMASPHVWRELCVTYAGVLEGEGLYHRAASYLLAANKVYDAINLLKQYRLYKDALCLAKVRLSPMDPAITELYLSWARYLTKESNLELAAKCYLAIRKPTDAAQVLARKSDLSALRAATHVTMVANQIEASKIYGSKFIQECQLRYDWLGAAQVVNWHECFRALGLTITVHELLVREFQKLELFEIVTQDQESVNYHITNQMAAHDIPKFLFDETGIDKLCPWEPHLVAGQTITHNALCLWQVLWKQDFHQGALRQAQQALTALRETKQAQTNIKQVLIQISQDVTLGLLHLLLCDLDLAVYWWTVAMATCHQAGHMNILQGLCRLLLPLGPHKMPEIQKEVTALRLTLTSDHTGTGPTQRNRRPSQPEGVPVGYSEPHPYIGNDTNYCTGVDCMAAFYYQAVLRHLTDLDLNHSQPQDNPPNPAKNTNPEDLNKAERRNGEDCINQEVEDIDKLGGKENITENGASIAGNGSSVEITKDGIVLYSCSGSERESSQAKGALDKCRSRTQSMKIVNEEENIRLLAWNLLWNSQAEQTKLMATLQYIQQAVARLITQNRQSAKTQIEGTPNVSEQTPGGGLVLPLVPPRLQRTVSGEYLHMKPGSNEPADRNEESTEVKTRLESPLSDYVEMLDPSQTMLESEKSKKEDSKESEQRAAGDDNDEANIKMKQSQNLDVSVAEEKDATEIADSDIPKIMMDGVERPRYPDIPEEWYKVAEDRRYTEKCVTLMVLTQEQKWVNSRLDDLACKLQSCPFPETMESVRLMCGVCRQPRVQRELAQWAVTYGYTSQHAQFFEMLLGEPI